MKKEMTEEDAKKGCWGCWREREREREAGKEIL